MTEDFKKKILDWISANYTTSSGNNVPQFSDVDNYTNELQNQLTTLFPYGWNFINNLQAYNVNGDGLKYTISYGEYNPTSSSTDDQKKGFIAILDDDFTLIQCITQYSSGTDFGYFEIMGVGDDGNFFAIEKTSTNTRFVMMNNIIAKLSNEANYKVILRRSYNLQGESANIQHQLFHNLTKAPEQSIYVICGETFYGDVILTELVINVGMSNDWNDFRYTPPQNDDFAYGDVYTNWSFNGDFNFKIAGFFVEGQTTKYAELSGDSNNIGTMTLTKYGAIESFVGWQLKIISSTEAYYMIDSDVTSDHYWYLYHVLNGVSTKIYSTRAPSDYNYFPFLIKIDNEIFYLIEGATGTLPNEQHNLEIGKIIGDNVYKKIIETSSEIIAPWIFVVQKQFNLYNYYIQLNNSVDKVWQVYNANDYNGQEYQALNSMIPKSAELVSESVIVFARDLYNKYINNNTTVSTINVPNSYTNDVVIDAQNLYGETKSELVQNNQDIETNIYEELMINFVNTLLMTNENDINNIIENLDGAIRVNKSISSLMDYDSCKITKFKINYSDNTNIVGTITNNNITYLSNKVVYKFLIYNNENKRVESIQLLSNDETTIYQTIDCTNLETNKYYMLEQDLHIN